MMPNDRTAVSVDQSTTIREHPLRVLRYSMRNLWLLIFPLLRGFSVYSFSTEGAYLWLKGAWADILVVAIIIIFGAVRWWRTRLEVNEDSVTYSEGVFFQLETRIPFANISVTTVERPFYHFIFKAKKVCFDTRAGFFRTTDLKLLLTDTALDNMLKRIPDISVEERFEEKNTAGEIMLFSLFYSSGQAGALYIATLFIKGGDIAQGLILEYLSKLTATTEKLTSGFILKIPAAALAVGTFFLAAWLVSFVRNIIRYTPFRITSDDDILKIRCGLLNEHRYRISYDQINFADLRQDLLLLLFDRLPVTKSDYSALMISCAGYGTDSRHLPVLLPMHSKEKYKKITERLCPDKITRYLYEPIKPKKLYSIKELFKCGWLNYVWIPLLFTVFLFPLSDKVSNLFPAFHDLIRFTGIMLIIPSFWFVVVKTVAFSRDRICFDNEFISVKCSKWMKFHSFTARRQNIVKLDVMQSFLQKRFGSRKCRITFWFCGEGITRYCLRAIDIDDAVTIAKELGFDHKITLGPTEMKKQT